MSSLGIFQKQVLLIMLLGTFFLFKKISKMANFRHKNFKMEITPGKEERWRRRNFSAHSLTQRAETRKATNAP
jgi:hypothetical protein